MTSFLEGVARDDCKSSQSSGSSGSSGFVRVTVRLVAYDVREQKRLAVSNLYTSVVGVATVVGVMVPYRLNFKSVEADNGMQQNTSASVRGSIMGCNK
jgi:hypothetical protein